MTQTRREFFRFLAPLALLPVVGPHVLLSEKPTWLGWRAAIGPRPLPRPGAYQSMEYDYSWVPVRSASYMAQWGWQAVGHSYSPGPGHEVVVMHRRKDFGHMPWHTSAKQSDTAA